MTPEPDEAQTQVPPAEVISDDPELFEFKIELRMDATVSVGGMDWVKPGVTAGKKWKIRNGNLPSREELEAAIGYIQYGAIDPVLTEMIDMISRRVLEAQSNR